MARIGPTIPQPMTTISHLSISTPPSPTRCMCSPPDTSAEALDHAAKARRFPSPQHTADPRGFAKLLLVRAHEFVEKRIQERIHAVSSIMPAEDGID